MPLGINCLIKDTQLADQLKKAVKFFAYERRGNGHYTSLDSVYKDIRKAGIEVDLESVAYAYNDIAPVGDPKFDSVSEVYDRVGENEAKAIRAMTLLESTGMEKIGELSAEKGAVNALMNFFTSKLSVDNRTKSLQKTFQDALIGHMKRLGDKIETTPATPEDWKNLVSKSLNLEKGTVMSVQGVAQGIKDVFNGMKTYLKEVTAKIDGDVDPTTAALWEKHIDDLQNATYTLLFNTKDAKAVMSGIMKEAGYTKEVTRQGKKAQVMDWNKLAGDINDVSQLRDNVINVLGKNGFDPITSSRIADALKKEYVDLRAEILQKAKADLDRRQERIGQPRAVEQKTDLERLAQLHALGVFNGAHDKVLFNALGVSDLDQKSIFELRSVAEKTRAVSRELDNKNIFGTMAFRSLQDQVNEIISANVNNKTKLTKVVKWYGNFIEVGNIGRLMGWGTMAENVLSGALATLESATRVKDVGHERQQDLQYSVAMWKDVMQSGQTFGKEHFKFGVGADVLEKMKLGFDTSSPKALTKSTLSSGLYLATALFRATQSGGDSFFKSYKTQKLFLLNVHDALVEKNGWSKDAAAQFVNESLYGQSFQDAKVRAKDLLNRVDLPSNDAAVTKLANDMVKQNLLTNGAMDAETVEAAWNSAYRVAGIGLGHEATWGFSRWAQAARDAAKTRESDFLKAGDYNGYARTKFWNTVVYKQVFPFVVGATNWVKLRVEKNLGVGIATGYFDESRTKPLDFTDKKSLQEDFTKRQAAKDRIARGLIGVTETAAATALYFGIKGLMGSTPDKDKKITDAITNNLILNKMMNKVGTDPMLLYYYANKDKEMWKASYDYFAASTNFGSDFDIRVQTAQIGRDLAQGKVDEAGAIVGNTIGSKFEVPLWNAYKGYGRVGQQLIHWNEKLPSQWQKPTNIWEGLLGGNALEDMGVFRRNSNIIALPAIGPKTAEKFQRYGFKNIRDLSGEWWNLEDEDGKYIIKTQKDRDKARTAYDQWMKLNK